MSQIEYNLMKNGASVLPVIFGRKGRQTIDRLKLHIIPNNIIFIQNSKKHSTLLPITHHKTFLYPTFMCESTYAYTMFDLFCIPCFLMYLLFLLKPILINS